jgi:hypothetical protein
VFALDKKLQEKKSRRMQEKYFMRVLWVLFFIRKPSGDGFKAQRAPFKFSIPCFYRIPQEIFQILSNTFFFFFSSLRKGMMKILLHFCQVK